MRSAKEQKKGKLTLFHACARTPAPGKEKCEEHLREDATAPIQDQSDNRKDLGPITRARAKALGVEEEVLSSGAGCRREKNITVRQTQEVTSGMCYLFQACGICIGHCEMISAG